jgi:hypothetical protein
MINLSDTIPAAINGGTNVSWQSDVSGNVSAYVAQKKLTVAPVAGVLTLDASVATSFLITINAAITAMTITNPVDGQEITLLWQQDSTGHTVTLATALIGAIAVTTTANKHTCQTFTYNVGDNNWYGTSPGINNL